MGQRQRGAFLIEAGLVTALGAVMAAASVPRMLQASIQANEQLAIATLKQVAKAQKTLRSMCAIDCDRDRKGEYGFFGELNGTRPLRTDQVGGAGGARLQPPLLSRMGRVTAARVARRGYVFQMFLPDTVRDGVAENATGGASGTSIDANSAEKYWCCYAWPVAYGSSGKRAFFINDSGLVLAADNTIMRYGGTITIPAPSAAYRSSSSGRLDCATAADTLGVDGQRWTQLR